ncbi:RNA polymerase sigma factor [Prevotella melaninogenica]|uniref:RNA polymerase sigma factor n=1 Tax=Prevotella melaninogenica TaxID=28132 RepID=UPI0001DD89E4|nr:RNA polymerase sigma factor [Prevotella melaninogenica]ADK97454.1 Sigma-70 region 2 [Prevotella melaninogenica ATCC 25845]ASE18171.1 RNA polymerase sigma factor [Prevotella melaninogenica]UEB09321.1 RNA polymerase sigma factor [Prevotella melaninogenica]
MTPLDEAEVIRLLASFEGRQKVFPVIVDQYSQSLYWKIRSIVLTHEDADDVLQNTFLKAWKSLPTFQGKAKLSTWLYRIAINESLDFLRRQKAATLSSADADLSVANRLLADDYFDGDKSQALLQEAIATLPDVQRTVFTLRYYDEMKYSDISEILGTSEGSLKASYHIAVQKITDYVKRYE